MGSHGAVLAAAMAVSGTIVLLVLCRQRPISPTVSAVDATTPLQPCISDSKDSEDRKARKKKKKKRVHFAERVVQLHIYEGWSAEEEREGGDPVPVVVLEEDREMPQVPPGWSECGRPIGGGGMPANRAALYSGILRDRHQRIACSY